jgi:hypothetical protein
MHYIPDMLKIHKVNLALTDGEDVYDKTEAYAILSDYCEGYFKRSGYSFDWTRPGYLTACVDFGKKPIAKAGEPLSFKIKFQQLYIYGEPIEGFVRLTLPEGWTAEHPKAIHIAKPRDIMKVSMPYRTYYLTSDMDVTVTPNENIAGVNRLYATVELTTSPIPFIIPITIVG